LEVVFLCSYKTFKHNFLSLKLLKFVNIEPRQMKIILFCYLLILTTLNFAQEKPETIIRDTINLRGYIYQSDGKPAKYFEITSSYIQADCNYANTNKIKIAATTDTNGYFKLHGAKLYDTLTINHQLLYSPQYFYNRGSRFMIIYLPPLKAIDLTADKPVIIAQRRLHPKAQAVYHPKPAGNAEYFEVHTLPRYIGAGSRKYDQSLSFTDSLTAHITYPPKAIANNIEGLVKISFTVGMKGEFNFKLLQGIGYGCDEEVINAIRKLSGWIPAINNGRALPVDQTISVEFKLTDK
jgi:TonB family protein